MYVRPDPTGGPDPPGSSDFVIQYINASFDSAGTASTITDHPPIESPSEKKLCIILFSPQFSNMAHQHQQSKHLWRSSNQ